MPSSNDIVQSLWNLCNILRDDGVTYLQYVTELTYLLFLKLAKETGSETALPPGYRWDDLTKLGGKELMDFYRKLLLDLGTDVASPRVKSIFAGANTALKAPTNLKTLVSALDAIDWFSDDKEQLGAVYEGLLEKNAGEKKSGAGQYFTPRPLIDSMVSLIKPKPGEVIQDPAAGTAGFLIAADAYIKKATKKHSTLTENQLRFQRFEAFEGVELVADAHRLALMNLMLHGIESKTFELGDTLTSLGEQLTPADVILSNPPFGTKKGGGLPSRGDFTYRTSNKQLSFLQHIYRGLKAGGRAAVVLPDNVLFEGNMGTDIRRDLMKKCNLHTVLRLPTGIFYAQGVKTNVLFFTRGQTDEGNTKNTWFFDMRSNMPSFGKRTPFNRDHFAEFEKAYGSDPYAKKRDLAASSEEGRWRVFSREEIAEREDNLDITWLKDESVHSADELPEPADIAEQILAHLRVAMVEMEALKKELGGA